MRLFGINPVAERLAANPRTIRKVYLRKRDSVSTIYHLCRTTGVPFETLSDEQFGRMASGLHTQGVIAETTGFSYVGYDTLLGERGEPQPTLVFLDGVSDPQNFGAILRTLACFGGFAVVLPQHDSVDVTETVLRVASGGEKFVPG